MPRLLMNPTMLNDDQLLQTLTVGLNQLALKTSLATQQAFIAYLELLSKWNRAYNLTAIREKEAMLTRHLLDSLSIAPYLEGKRIIDVGTGPGLPGIPLALLYPDRQFTLLDSNGKKTRFLVHAKQMLSLTNVEVMHTRAETFTPAECFDTVLSRAFASLADMLSATSHLCCQQGHFLAMKGQYPTEELAVLPEQITVTAVHALTVPGLDAERHLVCLQHASFR